MELTVNGHTLELPPGSSVADLLRTLARDAGPAAVEVNRDIVPKARHAEHRLRDGDTVEIVTLVGGG